ncbi:unnamed protein product [Schistocephalus solidus]|uniref:PH domain-containing protein n=1 Tax=Schistocephalus solidus TaxID=70667 RepID=A0A183SJN3_SCHSO|nr:unnamed protein product [Schistocephalus solidus]
MGVVETTQDCNRSRKVIDTGSTYVRGEENIRGWRPRSDSLIIDHQVELERLRRVASVEKTKQFLQLRDILRRTNHFDALRQLDENINKIQQRSFSWLQLKTFSSERGTDSGFHSYPKDASSDTFWSLADQQTPIMSFKKLTTTDMVDPNAPEGFFCNCNSTNENLSNPARPTSLFLPGVEDTNRDAESALNFKQKLLLIKCLKLLGYGKFSTNLMSMFGISEFAPDLLTSPMDERAGFSPAMNNFQNMDSASTAGVHKSSSPSLTDEACPVLMLMCCENERKPLKNKSKYFSGIPREDARERPNGECFEQWEEHQSALLIAQCAEVRISPVVNRKGFLLLLYENQNPNWVRRWVVIRRPFLYIHENERDTVERDIINLTTAKIECSLLPAVEKFAGGLYPMPKNDSEPFSDENAVIFLLRTAQRKVYVKTPERDADVHEWLYAFNPLMAGEISHGSRTCDGSSFIPTAVAARRTKIGPVGGKCVAK